MRLNDKRGFTLIEIMIVSAIFSMLVLTVFTVFKGGLDLWHKSESILDIYQGGRSALELISRDISSAFWFNNSTDQTQWTRFLGIDGATQPGSRIKTNSAKDELFFVSPVASNTGEAMRMDLCEIGYWLRSTDNCLMRHFQSFTTVPVTYNFSDAGSVDSKVASNVTDLNFTYYYRSATGTAPTATAVSWDSNQNILTNFDAKGLAKKPDGLPDAVEVSITLQSKDGTQKKTFTTIVSIPGAR